MRRPVKRAGWRRRLRRFRFASRRQPQAPVLPRLSASELRRLQRLPRLTPTVTRLAGHDLSITDPFWFRHMYEELWLREAYRFESANAEPVILDCGANIGLGVIYQKLRHPGARITAFEPDPAVFAALAANVQSFGLQDVTLHRQAVWSGEEVLCFEADGSVGGRIVPGEAEKPVIMVETVRLRDRLTGPIDLLKLDVEGAEWEVLRDCREQLALVERLFFEYHSRPDAPQGLHELLALVEQAGFRYHIQDANPVAHPFLPRERNPTYDLQLNVYAYRD